MDILVCIGSACHVRGSYGIMNDLKAMVIDNNLNDHIEVKVAFCLGVCRSGVTIKIGDQIVTGVTSENVKDIFNKYVLEKAE